LRCCIALHEKGGKEQAVPAHPKAEEYLDAYLTAAGMTGQKGTPLFRTLDRRRQRTATRLDRREALLMVKRQTCWADLGERICNHSFRATGITAYLEGGGTIDVNQPYCFYYQGLSRLTLLDEVFTCRFRVNSH